MATIKTRPDFEIRMVPVPTKITYGDGTGNLGGPALRASHYVKETSTGVRRRKPEGSWIAPTPYTFERTEIHTAGENRWSPYWTTTKAYGQWYQGIAYNVPGESQARHQASYMFNRAYTETAAKTDSEGLGNAALIAARNKLKSTEVDLGIAFAERKQTQKLIGDTATRIAQAFNSLKRGQTRRAMDVLGISSRRNQPRGSNIPQKWLELQYGWNPLLSDVYGACDSLATRNKDDWRVTAKAYRSTVVEKSAPMVGGSDYWNNGTSSARVQKSVFVRIDVLPVNEMVISLSSLGLLNPLSIVWEKTYLSFVVDWILPVGSFFDSLDAMLGYTTAGYSSSYLMRGEWTFKGNPSWLGPTSGYGGENTATGVMSKVYLNRTVSSFVPLPMPPRFKDPRSLGHMANGLALLAGAFANYGRSRS